jgi:uncharacterized membrane protein
LAGRTENGNRVPSLFHATAVSAQRFASIDIVRGVVMVLMVVDHAREYAAGPGAVNDPMNLDAVTPLLFWMRWATHFCAPVFAFLMGVSAWLASRKRPIREAQRHFAIRGLLLILVEFTLVDWAWTFNPLWPRKFFQVIAALGVAQVALAALAGFGARTCLFFGAAIVFGHNLLDGVRFEPGSAAHYVWSFLHQRNVLPLGGGFEMRTTYPVLPIIGLTLCGFGLARWLFCGDEGARLRKLGWASIAVFVVLRASNAYGDPFPFVGRDEPGLSAMSFLNVTKYPVSLQFALMTLGPAMLLLGWLERRPLSGVGSIVVLGQVPLFFYVSHLYALHVFALLAALAMGFPPSAFHFAHRFGGIPEGFGFPLWLTPLFALATTLILLPACRWYSQVRREKRYPALAYF